LNRDDLGAPKSAIFGGVMRARISSQCLKRSIRMQAKELCPDLFKGERSRLIIEPIKAAVIAAEVPEEKALEAAKNLCAHLASIDEKAEKDNGIRKVKTLM
jgi:CRISPR system Cascade subunit CasC